MPYLMGGFPDLETSAAVIDAYADTGADLIELGVPYSDPLADGPADPRRRHGGARGRSPRSSACWSSASGSPARVPVLPMVYANVVLTLGPERFAAALEAAGAAGAIVPDLPRAEDPSVAEALLERGLAPIGFVSPTTSPERLREIARGGRRLHLRRLADRRDRRARRSCRPSSGRWSRAVREASEAPAAVGFGIGTPEQAAQVGAIADGVIIGTRLVRAVADAADRDAAVDAVSAFMADTRIAL